ncbi:MAG: DUF1295 domain-containing protein [Nitrospirales bacterium]
MTQSHLTLILDALIGTAVLMGGLWLWQRKTHNAGIVDVGWCLGLIGVSVLFAQGAEGDPDRRYLLAGMISLYAARLGGYLFRARVQDAEEDPRYRRFRQAWGKRAQLYFFFFFEFQAVGIVLFSVPLLMLMENPSPQLSLWEYLGAGLWVVAVAGEAVADAQLARFKADPANYGKVCRGGLWRYSRHPNYFFEWLHWCAYVPMGLGVPYGWVTLINPLTMLIFLLWISGIPLAEAQALASRGDAYRDYQRTTHAFFPWFRKEHP